KNYNAHGITQPEGRYYTTNFITLRQQNLKAENETVQEYEETGQMRSLPPRLTSAQKSKVTLSLFTTVALFAIFTVAAPPFLPCPALDDTQRRALLEQRLKAAKLEGSSRKKVVVISRNKDDITGK
ncbi:3283_t:CDS:2, partial [Racocetra persica]